MATDATVPAPANPALARISGFPALGSYELIRIVERGLPTDCLEQLKEWGLTFTEIGQIVIPPRTLKHRNARGERLTPGESERFLRLVRVLQHGERVFGDREKLLNWLRAPDPEIDNRSSLSILGDESGARLVESQLWGLADGVYS